MPQIFYLKRDDVMKRYFFVACAHKSDYF